MPDLTPNHGLQLWAAGELDWQHRDDMQALDTAVEIRDFAANRTNYTAKSGALFRSTDTGAIYQGDGTNWVLADLEVDALAATTATVATAPAAATDVARKTETDAVQGNLDTHTADTTNPHSVTAAQTSALPTSGGTMSGEIDLNGANGIDNAHSYDWAARDGSGDVWRLTTATAAASQILTYYAAGGGSTQIYRARAGGHFDIINGDVTSETGDVRAPTGSVEGQGVRHLQRGAVTTADIDDGQRMTYVSDGTDAHAAGDLVSARNNAGTIVTQVIAAAVDDA